MAMRPATIAKKREEAAELSRELGQHRPRATKRERLWRELHAAGVTVNDLAADSGLTPMAVRAVLNRK